MRQVYRFLLLSLAGLALPAKAIVNIEDLRMDETKPGWAVSSTLSFDGKRGNLKEDKFALSGGMQWIRDDIQIRNLVLLTIKTDRADDVTYSEEYFGHLRHTRQLTDITAWEVFGQYQHEPLNNEYTRQLAGSNLRFRVARRLIDGYFGAGMMFEQRSVEPTPQTLSERSEWRFNFYLSSRYELNDHAEFAMSYYIQPALSDVTDIRAIVNAGLTSRITRLFSLTLDLSYNHESEPLQGQANNEWTYGMGVNLRF